MKKYFTALFVIVFTLASCIIFRSYSTNILYDLLGTKNGICRLYIKSVDKSNSNKVIEHIYKCVKNQNLDIYYLSFDNLLPHKKQQISIYINDFEKIKDNISLKSGRFLKSDDNINCYLSSVDNGDVNEVGVIKYPNKKMDIYIRPLSYKINQEYDNLFSMFFVNTTNNIKLSNLINNLESQYDIKIQNMGSINYTSMLDILESLKILAILYILMVILLVHMIFERYKELAVYKLFGMDRFNISFRVIFKDILIFNIKAVGVTYFLSLIYLCIFNGYYGLLSFSILWLKTVSIILMANLVVSAVIINFLTRFIKIRLMLKNKKPINIALLTNYIFKIISLAILINLFIHSYLNASLLSIDNDFVESWEQSKYLAKINVKSNTAKQNNSHIDFGDEFAHKFFVLTNQKNGILIDTSNYWVEDKCIENKVPYTTERSINVNNNYLKMNPIYDINNNVVDISDHNDVTVNLLVPIKYKIYENKIRDLYTSGYENYKPDINITYVKDNQKYFTFKLDSSLEGSYITDPVVNIISNNNAFISVYYGCAITNSYYIKINNPNFPAKDLMLDLEQSGFNKYVSSISTVYEQISNELYRRQSELMNSLMMLLFSFIILITLIVFIALNYLEKNKLESFILKIHGVNYFRRHFQYYLTLVNIWCISLVLILLMSTNSFYLSIFNKFCVSYIFDYKNIIILFFIIDIIISVFLLQIYERKKIYSVIKGE